MLREENMFTADYEQYRERLSLKEKYITLGQKYLSILGNEGIVAAAIVGSTSYEPKDGDDIDIFIISNRNLMWFIFLKALFLRRLMGEEKICLSLLMDFKFSVDYFSNLNEPLIISDAYHAVTFFGKNVYQELLDLIPKSSFGLQEDCQETKIELEKVDNKNLLSNIGRSTLNLISMLLVLPPVLIKAMVNSKKLKGKGGAFKVVFGWRKFYFDTEKYRGLKMSYGGNGKIQ